MALADDFTTDQPQFRPSPNVAAAVLHYREPAPVMSAYGPLSVQPSQEVFNSTEDATARSPVEVTRTSIGERIERMLATLAFHSVDRGQPVIVAERNEFSPQVAQQVLLRLQVPQSASGLLKSLAEDLRATVANAPIRRDWGELRLDGDRLVLHPAPRAAAPPPSRPAAKVVGRTLIE